MKYIAIFDIPDDYGIGCAIANYWVGKRDYEPRWIPVTEKLPEKNGFYLCCYEAKNKGGVAVDEGLSIIQYLDGKWHLIDTYNVTHWMPLPDKPKGER